MASDFMTAPAVFAVHNVYHIMVPVNCETLMWVKVGDKCYYDDSNGILRSAVTVHRMIVPADELNEAKKYTVCYRKVIKREPYFTKTEDVCEMEYDFIPVEKDRMVAYHIADAHNMVDAPVAAAKKFEDSYGKLDFLILNGDVIEHSGSIKNFYNIYKIASEITGGRITVVFSRGNHDTRGIFAENIAEYTPCENGKSYFSFRLGSLWGVVLDCGEDKPDTSIEYGNTICCADFRQKETQFIKELIADAEYNHAEVKHKIVVVHMPFTRKNKPPFNIEEDTYYEWAKLLKDNVKPEIMICGHTHQLSFDIPNCDNDAFGQPCPVAVGSMPDVKNNSFVGSGFVFDNNGVEIVYNDKDNILETYRI